MDNSVFADGRFTLSGVDGKVFGNQYKRSDYGFWNTAWTQCFVVSYFLRTSFSVMGTCLPDCFVADDSADDDKVLSNQPISGLAAFALYFVGVV
jgi:hypothetical protein